MNQVTTGLNNLRNSADLQQKFTGRIGYLCNSASVDTDLDHGIKILKAIFGSRFSKAFSPQHGLFADVQDDMLESPHVDIPFYDIRVYSLYAETRFPKQEWLEDLDHLIIDLQDVGVRIYTYIYTAALAMTECAKAGVKVTILDRPNPVGGEKTEGNVLEKDYSSFVGMYEIPMRHGLTTGEFCRFIHKHFSVDCDLEVIPLQNWKRSMYFRETGLPWVMTSPNFPSMDTALVYPGNVLLEGTNLSEGRGTVKPFELFGHPDIDPLPLCGKLEKTLSNLGLTGFALRPLVFKPTFHKYQDQVCGGFQLHVTDPRVFQSWRTAQVLIKEIRNNLGDAFQWKSPPYEYEYEKLPIDILNGTDKVRKWIENNGSYDQLLQLENEHLDEYMQKRDNILIYP